MGNNLLKSREVIAYSGVALAMAIMMDPIPTIMFQFYVQHTTVTLAAVGTVLFFSRFVDAATDPAIGYFSDKTNSSLGKRKPWIIVGGVLGAISVYYFFNPSSDSGILYFAIFCNIYYLCRTLIAIPFAAWGSEITRDYDERAKIGAWFGIILLGAQMLFLAFPVIVSSPLLPLFDSAELGPEMISMIGWVGIIFIPLSIIPAVWLAPKGDDLDNREAEGKRTISLIDNIRATAYNKPFWIFLVSKTLGMIGFLIFFSVAIIAMDNYLGLRKQVPVILVGITMVQVVSIPVWQKIATRVGKHQVIAIGWLFEGLLLPLIFFIEPGDGAFIPFFILASLTSIMQAPGMVFSNAVLSDVIDYDILKTGVNRAGSYFSIDAFLLKCVSAFAGSIGFWLLAYFQYDPKITANTQAAEFGLLLTLTIVPSIFLILAAIVLFFFPINAKRHAIIRRRIQTRDSRKTA